jgi:DNA-binding transcriptional ArsR family regulator
MHRALADPLRIRLLDALWVGPRSARELADRLDLPADRLYYHLKQLQRAGLIEVVEYRELAGGKVERVYGLVQVEPPGDNASPAEMADALGQMVQTTRMDITDWSAALERGAKRRVALTRTGFRLSEGHLTQLVARVQEMLREARDNEDEDGVWSSVLFVVVDRQDRPASSESEKGKP